VQQLQSPIADSAIVQDADVELGLDGGVISSFGEGVWKSACNPDHPDTIVRKLARAIGPAIVPDAIDPALRRCRKRPPPDREDEGDRLVAQNAFLLGEDHRGIDFPRIIPIGFVGGRQPRVKIFSAQICNLRAMT